MRLVTRTKSVRLRATYIVIVSMHVLSQSRSKTRDNALILDCECYRLTAVLQYCILFNGDLSQLVKEHWLTTEEVLHQEAASVAIRAQVHLGIASISARFTN